jgi:uncharacterized phiE125 gp8 family phage protein
MTFRLITPPTARPVQLSDVKAFLRIDSTDDDALLDTLIRGAVQHLDGWRGLLGLALMPQTWEVTLDTFPCRIKLPLGPVISVTSVRYLDAGNVLQTLPVERYQVLASAEIIPAYGQIWPATLCYPDAVRVQYVAGHSNAAAVPEAIKQLIMLLIGHWYENRLPAVATNVNELPFSLRGLLDQYRVVHL